MAKSLKNDAIAALNQYKEMKLYQIQEKILQHLLIEYPDHTCVNAVETKVKLLNLFYSTGIKAINVVAEKVNNINNIDERLKQGDMSLINEIASINLHNNTSRFNYSFATKYCAYHQPDKFPIYDSIVAMTFESLFEKSLLPPYKYSRKYKFNIDNNTFTKTSFSTHLKEYPFFVEVYNLFMKLYDLQSFTYRQVDSYIWGAFKIAGDDFEIEKMADLDKLKIKEYYID